jgi:fatty-acyl-CoA synthase
VEPREGESLDQQALLDSLRGKVADWWIPDNITQVSTMPLASTGKIDKIRLRAEFAKAAVD